MTFPFGMWQHLARHPLSAEYGDVTGPAFEAMVANLQEHGLVTRRPVTLYEGKVLDGWQLQRACVKINRKPEYVELPAGVDPAVFVATANDHRRHETQAQALARVEARRTRVAEARRAGKSTRAIADDEGVDQKTVRRDLDAATEAGASVEPEGGTVVGKDKKKRAASKPKKADPPPPAELRDGLGKPVPQLLRDVFGDPWLREQRDAALAAEEAAEAFERELVRLLRGKSQMWAAWLRTADASAAAAKYVEAIQDVRVALDGGVPFAVCPTCGGTGVIGERPKKGRAPACNDPERGCRGTGWVPKHAYDERAEGGTWHG